MKTAISLLLLLIGVTGFSQGQLQVHIIGTAHSFSEEYQHLQSFDDVQAYIKTLDPDIICIEATPTHDHSSLREISASAMTEADQLRDTLKTTGSCDAFGGNSKLRKGAEAFSNYDFWNGYYHWFQALEDGDSLGFLSRHYRDQSNSEYGLMLFPAARDLGIDYLHGIDYRADEQQFLTANSKVMKKLLFTLKWKPIRTYLKIQQQYKKAEKAGMLIEFINGDEFQNAFSELIDDLPNKLPRSEEAQFVKAYWLKRNEIMAKRIIETAMANKAKNILLTVGSAHVTHIKYFLEQEGHQVTTYGDILERKRQ